jgi:hypothetical protein
MLGVADLSIKDKPKARIYVWVSWFFSLIVNVSEI